MSNQFTHSLCSIICTTYNHSAYCAVALQSIFSQTFRNIEIVIIDDGSTDDNVQALENSLVYSPFLFLLAV